MSVDRRYLIVDEDADVASPPPLHPDELAVRVRGPLSDDGYRRLASLFENRPDVELWIDHRAEHLELLAHLRGLRHLSVQSLRLASWDGLRHVAGSLEQLHMREGTLHPVSIAPLGALSHLTALGLIGPVRRSETIGRLIGLEDLSLRSVTLPDLSLLLPMTRLRRLYFGLGGTSDLSLLPRLERLEELELWRIRGLRDVSMLGSISRLRKLRLESMAAITDLRSLGNATELRSVALCAMKGISDLSAVAAAPNLEELIISDMPKLTIESFRPLVGHPTLRRGIWGVSGRKLSHAVYEMLPMGQPPYDHPDFPAWAARTRAEDGEGPG